MKTISIKTKISRLYRQLSGSTIECDLSPYADTLKQINGFEKVWKIPAISSSIRCAVCYRKSPKRYFAGSWHYSGVRPCPWSGIPCAAYARLWCADSRCPGDEQRQAGGDANGEGKTLTAVFPAFVHSLSGKGVHVLTFNDYLARRDAQWMGPVYTFLNLKVGCVQEGMSIQERQKAYAADITYLTAKRRIRLPSDSLCYREEDIVHRSFHFAIIDEADSI